MFARLTLTRPPLPALPSTAAELAATKPRHDAHMRAANAALKDFEKMDGAFRIVVVRKP